MGKVIKYPESYIEDCFTVWYSAGRPESSVRIVEIIPEYDGHKPDPLLIRRWRASGNWDIRADEMDAKAVAIIEDDLIKQRADMLRRHMEGARELADKARQFIMSEGFDSSASAVNAYFKATDEERTTTGLSQALLDIFKSTPDELTSRVQELLERASANNQTIVDFESKENEEKEKDKEDDAI